MLASRFPNGAMSAAFRVAFNDSINSPRGRKLWDAEQQRVEGEAMSGGFSPLPADFEQSGGGTISLSMMSDFQLHPTDGSGGGAYQFDSNGLVYNPRHSGALEGVYPSTWWYGGKTLNFARLGREIVPGRDPKLFRIAPFGNRTGHKTGKFPHYHRRGIDPKNGQTLPGQSVKRHRPWDVKSTDKSFWDRF